MAAERGKPFDDDEIDLMEEAQLRQALKTLVKDLEEMKDQYKEKPDADEAEDAKSKAGHEEAKHTVGAFNSKNVSKPSP